MSATHPARTRSAAWLSCICFAALLTGCGTQSPNGHEPEKPGSDSASGTKAIDAEYWPVEKLRLDRMVLAECHSKIKGDPLYFEVSVVRILYGDVEYLNAQVVEKESAFVLKHRVDIKKFRDEFNGRHPLTEMLYKEPLPVAVEAVNEVILEFGVRKDATDAKLAAVEAAAKTKLRNRPTYKALVQELE